MAPFFPENPDPLQELFKTWIDCGMPKHSPAVLKKNIKNSHTKFIQEVGLEECNNAVKNYAFILKSPLHYWSHRWTIWDFITRGLSRFLDEEKPRDKWLQRKGKHHSSREDQQREEYEKHNSENPQPEETHKMPQWYYDNLKAQGE